MLLSFDIAGSDCRHDDWHTHEHLPERLSIPGFVRGTRWVALQGRHGISPCMQVKELATLTSAAVPGAAEQPQPVDVAR